MASIGASLAANGTGSPVPDIPLTHLDSANDPPSNATSISNVDVPNSQNDPATASGATRNDKGPVNGNTGIHRAKDIDRLAFKRDPRNARAPYDSTLVEYVS